MYSFLVVVAGIGACVSTMLGGTTIVVNNIQPVAPVEQERAVEVSPTPTATVLVPLQQKTRVVSAYTLGSIEETDSTPCHGAWGDDLCALVKSGTQVCASNEFPRGTKLAVGDTIECVVMDRMNRRYPNRVDVAGMDHEANIQFGVQKLSVSVIKSSNE